MIRVKVVAYKKGYVVSIGIDPLNPHKLPVKIFHENRVVDPLLYAVTGAEISDADNAIYVKKNEVEKIINEIKDFYARYGEYFDMKIPVNIIEIDDTNQGQNTGATVEKLKISRRPKIKKLSIEEIVEKKTSNDPPRKNPMEKSNYSRKSRPPTYPPREVVEMKITLETEEKNKKITIPSAFGEITIEAERAAIIKIDGTPIYSIFYTKDGDFIASIPPSIVKINDPINFSEIFNKRNYGELAPYLKKTIIPAMARAAGYEDTEKFIDEKLIKIIVKDFTGKDHPEEIYSDAIIVEGRVGEHAITTAWKKINTPTVPTISRFIIKKGLSENGEKDFIEKTLDELKELPFAGGEKIKDYATKYVKHIIRENLRSYGML